VGVAVRLASGEDDLHAEPQKTAIAVANQPFGFLGKAFEVRVIEFALESPYPALLGFHDR
jgi:hypothetical protein